MFCFLLQDDYFKFYSIKRWRCDERWKAEEEEERDLLWTHHSALAECRPLAGGRGSEETRNSGLCSLPHPGIPKGPPSPPLSSGNRKRKWEPVSWLPLSNTRGQVTPSADSGEGRHCGNSSGGVAVPIVPLGTRAESPSECRAKTGLKSSLREWHRPS